MKKTTYILIGALCAVVLFSFFLPAIMFSGKESREGIEELTVTLNPTGITRVIEIEDSDFSELALRQYENGTFDFADSSSDLSFDIEQNDSIEKPRLIIDSSWEPLIETIVKDNILSIGFKDTFRDGRGVTYLIPENNMHVATLILPKGKVDCIQQQFNMISSIRNFDNNVLRISRIDEIKFISCRIDSLCVNTYDE